MLTLNCWRPQWNLQREDRIEAIKKLTNSQRVLSVFCLMFAAIGIVLMIVEIEIVNHFVPIQPLTTTFFIKVMVTVFTGALLISLVLYHRICLKLFMAENSVSDWLPVLTFKRLSQLLLEMLICSIHPVPVPGFNYIWSTFRETEAIVEMENVPVDVVLTIVMFLRGYLLLRVLVLHTEVHNRPARRCAQLTDHNAAEGTLHRAFALKYLLTVHSRAFLVCSALLLILWTSWAVRVCEIYERKSPFGFFNNIWFIAITFFTIGYGEIVPKSTCGRFVAALAGTFGVAYTAYVVAVVAETLQLTYSEAGLHQFVVKNDLQKSMREHAARIIQCCWRLRKLANSGSTATQIRLVLLASLRELKILKSQQTQLEMTSLRVSRIHSNQCHLLHDITSLQDRLNRVESLVMTIAARLTTPHKNR